MTADGFYIDEASLRNLRINIKAFKKEVLAASLDGLKAFGMRIVAKAQMILRDNKNIATGLLRNSGRTVVQPDNTVDAGFYANYAAYVEYGRKAGGMPPVDDIYAWIRKKRIRPTKGDIKGDIDRQQRSLAWAIAKYIKEHGTRPHPFLKPAYDEYRTQIGQFMQRIIDQTVEQFKPKK